MNNVTNATNATNATSKSNTIDLSIALSGGQQAALVGHAMISEEFLLKCKTYVQPEWLTSDLLVAHLYKELVTFYDNYKMMPKSGDELLSEPFFRAQSPQDYQKYVGALTACIQQAYNFSLDILRPKIGYFIKTQKAREQAKILVNDLNKHNYDKGVQAAQEIIRAWTQIDFEASPYVDFSDSLSIWTQAEHEEVFFSTGSKTLDNLLDGGLFPGGNLAVLAPTFTGKSRFLMTLARHALVQNKKVLFIIHEDNPEKVKRRIISAVCGIGPREIEYILKGRVRDISIVSTDWQITNWSDSDIQELTNFTIQQIEAARELLNKNLVFVPWQKAARMFVEDVIEEIKRIQLEQIAKTGCGFDLVVDDYPALLRSRIRHEHERARLSYVYQCFNDLAAELKTFCAYAVQVNRTAAKEMKSGAAEQAIDLEDVSESYQIAMNAMSAISLNRTQEDSQRQILRIAVIKSRDSRERGMLITRSAYNEVSLYGDDIMYKDYGKMLIKGLKGIKESQYMISTSTADQSISDIEANVTQSEAVLRSTAPIIVKKIKGLPIINS